MLLYAMCSNTNCDNSSQVCNNLDEKVVTKHLRISTYVGTSLYTAPGATHETCCARVTASSVHVKFVAVLQVPAKQRRPIHGCPPLTFSNANIDKMCYPRINPITEFCLFQLRVWPCETTVLKCRIRAGQVSTTEKMCLF
jgi:hypothetical protein